MPSNKLKKFCRLSKYLEQSDKEFYQALDDLCLLGLLRVRGNGVTLLYPTNKTLRKTLVKYAYSNEPEKAVDMFKTLVLLDFLPRPSDFKPGAEIANAHHKKLEVKSADSKGVELKSGHKLELAKDFANMRKDEPVAVYHLSGTDELPNTGSRVDTKAIQQKNIRGGARGGSEVRKKIAKKVEAIYNESLLANGDVDNTKRKFYRTIMSTIYKFAKDHEKYRNLIKPRICATARASFYSIVNPYGGDDPVMDSFLLDMGLSAIIDCNDTECIVKLSNHEDYDKNLNDLVGKLSKPQLESRQKSQTELLDDISQSEIKQRVSRAYNDKDRLYRDLITIFCYLATINEISDPKYFNGCFVYSMEHVFNTKGCFNSQTDLVANVVLYQTLLKSDVFLFEPGATKEQISDAGYADLGQDFPVPTEKNLFTVQYSEQINVRGGNDDDSEFSGTYFGGLLRG